jgi:hypothetical protein
MMSEKPFQKTPLKLIKRSSDSQIVELFKSYEIFESSTSVRITISKNYSFDYIRSLIECVDERISIEDRLYVQFDEFLQKNEDRTSINIRFDQKNGISRDEFVNIIARLFEQSEIVKNEKDTMIVELPLDDLNFSISAFSFKKCFQSKGNLKSFLIFTNDPELIDLYKKL